MVVIVFYDTETTGLNVQTDQIIELGMSKCIIQKHNGEWISTTVDEINETLLLNLDSQRRTGILNRLTDAQRSASAINFA